MPVIKSAIKKLKQDRKKEQVNDLWRKKVQDVLRSARKTRKVDVIEEAFSVIDKAAKHNIFHENKAARLKSQLSKIVADGTPKTAKPKKAAKPTKSAPKKTTKKATASA